MLSTGNDLIRERYIWRRLKGRGEFRPRRSTRPCHLPNASVNHLCGIIFSVLQLKACDENSYKSSKNGTVFFAIILPTNAHNTGISRVNHSRIILINIFFSTRNGKEEANIYSFDAVLKRFLSRLTGSINTLNEDTVVLGAGDGPYALRDRNSGFPAFVRSNAGNFGNFAGAGVYTEGTRTWR